MASKIKRKQNKPNSKIKADDIKGSYQFKYLKFNFSFLSTNKDYNFKKLDKQTKADLIDRIEELSSVTFMQLSSLTKERGFERIKENSISISANYKEEKFNEGDFRNNSNTYLVFRLYPNNNPRPIRLIGKDCNNIFYLLYIDKEHKCYK